MCRLQKFWLPIISSLLLLAVTEVFAAESVVKLYSALGEPLMAEIELTAAEQQASSLHVEGGGYSWKLLPISNRGTVLLLSEEEVSQPILELLLHADSIVRPLVLLPGPVAQHSGSEFLQQLISTHNSVAEQSTRLQQQLEQAQLKKHSELRWLQLPEGMVVSRWLLFLLLGLLVALLTLRWWRSAEWVDLGSEQPQQKIAIERSAEQGRFEQAVAQIEAEIQPSRQKEDNP